MEMSQTRSPLKARTTGRNGNILLKQLGKRQLKRKSALFGASLENNSEPKEPPKKRLFDYDDSFDGSLVEGYSLNNNNNFLSAFKQPTSPTKTFVVSLPTDLRLATKVRVVSERPFPFSCSVGTNVESSVQFDASLIDESCRLLREIDLKDMQQANFKGYRPLAILKSAGLYYQYPDIAYMQMFPRLNGIARTKGIRTSLITLGNEIVDAIHKEWIDSFEHLYNSWKTGRRGSFYVCCPQFTILFIKIHKQAPATFDPEETCMGVNDFWEHRAILTPTPDGLRQLLKKKGIPFVLPVNARRLSKDGGGDSCTSFNDSTYYSDSFDVLNSSCSAPPKREGTPEKENRPSSEDFFTENAEIYVSPLKLGEDVEQEEWLRVIGQSPSKFKVVASESQDQFSTQDTVSSVIASSAGTTISLVQLDAIDAFKELMLDTNLGWAKTGQQAGLPPTLLATEPFLNASLKSLNFNTQTLQKPEGARYTLNIEGGPILPHVPQLLHEFLRVCNNQLVENALKFHVNGRSACNGFNEATADTNKNLNEFAYDGTKLRYYY